MQRQLQRRRVRAIFAGTRRAGLPRSTPRESVTRSPVRP